VDCGKDGEWEWLLYFVKSHRLLNRKHLILTRALGMRCLVLENGEQGVSTGDELCFCGLA
jgi:hypothetical protein